MGCKIIFAPQAIADLAEIVSYIAKDNPEAAKRLGLALIDRDIGKISAHRRSLSQTSRRSEIGFQTVSHILPRLHRRRSSGHLALLARRAGKTFVFRIDAIDSPSTRIRLANTASL